MNLKRIIKDCMSAEAFQKTVTILLVDSDEGDAALLDRVLEHSRIRNQLHVVQSAEEALQFLRKESPFEQVARPKLMFVELDLPGMSGLDLLRTMKGDPSLRPIPVLVLTRSENRHDLKAAYDERARAVITKPSDPSEFESMVRRIEAFWLEVVQLPSD